MLESADETQRKMAPRILFVFTSADETLTKDKTVCFINTFRDMLKL